MHPREVCSSIFPSHFSLQKEVYPAFIGPEVCKVLGPLSKKNHTNWIENLIFRVIRSYKRLQI
jgi:hypothetical protein